MGVKTLQELILTLIASRNLWIDLTQSSLHVSNNVIVLKHNQSSPTVGQLNVCGYVVRYLSIQHKIIYLTFEILSLLRNGIYVTVEK